MEKKFYKKIIAQSDADLNLISALCSDAQIKLSEIKFLLKNKIFLILLNRIDKEDQNQKNIQSVLRFEHVNIVKSKNINQIKKEEIFNLITIDSYKMEKKTIISLYFNKKAIINLEVEVIDITLEDQKILNY